MANQKETEGRALSSGAAWLWDWAIDHWFQIAVTLSGVVVAKIAAVSKWLGGYGPIAWIAAGLLFVVIVSVTYALVRWLIAKAKLAKTESQYREALARVPRSVNPLLSSFEKERLRVSDFYAPFSLLNEGKTFRDCEIIGPGCVAMLGQCSLFEPHLIACDVVAVKSAHVKTAVGFSKSAFHNCKFINVTLMVPFDAARDLIAPLKDSSTGQPVEVIGLNA